MKRKTQNAKRKSNVYSIIQIIKQDNGYLKTILALTLIILISGCTSLKETYKGFIGVSTKELEAGRQSAIKKTFDYDYFTSFTKVLDILKDMNAYIYDKDIKNHIIAIYVSQEDTTPVGIFFKEIGSSATQIEVSSPSKFTKEYIAENLFKALGKKPQTTEEKKGKVNAEK